MYVKKLIQTKNTTHLVKHLLSKASDWRTFSKSKKLLNLKK